MLKLAPSLLAADFSRLNENIRAIEEGGAQYLHLDVMDGSFVPSISFGTPVIGSLRSCARLKFDVHMMVEEPGRFVRDYAEAGAQLITVHAEACRHLDRVVRQIRGLGVQVGVALNPATSLSALDYILNEVDMIQILRGCLNERGLSADIQVDGGVTLANAKEIVKAGATVLVAGSAVFKGDIRENTRAFVKLLEECELRK